MPLAALLLLFLSDAAVAPRIVLDDETSCLDAAMLEEQLNALLADDPDIAGLGLRIAVAADGSDRILTVALYPHEPRPPLLSRELHIAAVDCASAAALVGHIVARGLEGLPRSQWRRPVSPGAPLVSTARVDRRARLPHETAPDETGVHLDLSGGLGLRGPITPRLGFGLGAALGVPAWPRAVLALDVTTHTHAQPLGRGSVRASGLSVGLGVEFLRLPIRDDLLFAPQVTVDAGGTLGVGAGFPQNRVDLLPSAGVTLRLPLLLDDGVFLRTDVGASFVEQRFTVAGSSFAHVEPLVWAVVLIGAHHEFAFLR